MLLAEHPQTIGEHLLEQRHRFRAPLCVLVCQGQVIPRRVRTRVAFTPRAHPFRQVPLMQADGLVEAARVVVGHGEVIQLRVHGLEVAARRTGSGDGLLPERDRVVNPSHVQVRLGQGVLRRQGDHVVRAEYPGAIVDQGFPELDCRDSAVAQFVEAPQGPVPASQQRLGQSPVVGVEAGRQRDDLTNEIMGRGTVLPRLA